MNWLPLVPAWIWILLVGLGFGLIVLGYHLGYDQRRSDDERQDNAKARYDAKRGTDAELAPCEICGRMPGFTYRNDVSMACNDHRHNQCAKAPTALGQDCACRCHREVA